MLLTKSIDAGQPAQEQNTSIRQGRPVQEKSIRPMSVCARAKYPPQVGLRKRKISAPCYPAQEQIVRHMSACARAKYPSHVSLHKSKISAPGQPAQE